MSTYIHTFTGPKLSAERRGKCPTCGKTTRRTMTFEGTVNPFNRAANGEPKTWQEVADDIRAKASAWNPGPEVFEHEKCRQARLAPEPAGTEAVPAEADRKSVEVYRAAVRALAWLMQERVPFDSLEVSARRWHNEPPHHEVWLGFVPANYLGLWARSLGLDPLRVERGHGSLDVHMSSEVLPGVRVRVACSIHQRDEGPAWGGAPIVWRRSERTGKPIDVGDVSLDDLLAGLSAMGIPQYARATPSGGDAA